MLWLFPLCAALALVTAILALRLYGIKKSVEEIRLGFSEKLTSDTNTVISVSTGDKTVRLLANDINAQLKELRRQRNRFVRGDAELKNAVTGISHDLRTPLTAISGYLELLRQEEKSETVSRYLSVIENRTEAMNALTEELFRYSVVISPDRDTAAEDTDVKAVLEESVLSLRAALEQHGIAPEVHMTNRQVIRRVNCTALARVFENLLQNAIKYSAGDLEIGLTEEGEIFFENSAPELDGVTVEKLFDRFYTVDTARRSTGLGLSIARTLTEQMGGSLTADCQNGRLRMKVTLP